MEPQNIDLKLLETTIKKELADARETSDFDAILKKYLEKETGVLSKILRGLKDLPEEQRKIVGPKANELNALIREQVFKVSQTKGNNDNGQWVDITEPAKICQIGHLHPITLVLKEVERIFGGMGFEIALGTEIENDWYNFDALNIPKDHPARDMWDTFWIKDFRPQTDQKEKLLLRTHTSPAQVHYMQKQKPPLRVIVPGRVFRHEMTDASHEFDFFQIEGLMVDQNINVANFQAILNEFFNQFFGKQLKIKLRPSFFPFTEPSFEVDISCINCNGAGCPACKQTGWMELMGAGMVHPKVLENAGIDSKKYQGFAFGIGLDRLAMLKYKINDIRLFKGCDLRFLKQF